MKITKTNNIDGTSRTGVIVNMTTQHISKVLGFKPNIEDDPDKVKYCWGFKADGVRCAIWDYRGSYKQGQFSTYGPAAVFEQLFGIDNYVYEIP